MLFERNIQLIDWKGIGYIVLDPRSGAGAYMISGGLAGGSWALIMKCFKEIKDFVERILKSSLLAGLINFIEDLINIQKSNVSSLGKWAARILAALLFFHTILYYYVSYQAILVFGAAFWEIFILAMIFIAITVVLYIIMSWIIGRPAFKSCLDIIK